MATVTRERSALSSDEVRDLRDRFVPRGLHVGTSVVVASASGAEVFDPEGRRYLDFVAGIGALNLGHQHPAVRAYSHVSRQGKFRGDLVALDAPEILLHTHAPFRCRFRREAAQHDRVRRPGRLRGKIANRQHVALGVILRHQLQPYAGPGQTGRDGARYLIGQYR